MDKCCPVDDSRDIWCTFPSIENKFTYMYKKTGDIRACEEQLNGTVILKVKFFLFSELT